VFVSADPRNDDLDKIESYVHAFNPRFIGATGLPDEVSTLAKSMHLFFSNADGNPDPVITHSDVLLLINPQAELVAIFNAPNDPMTVALDFRAIQRRAP
jgi:protein SCO1